MLLISKHTWPVFFFSLKLFIIPRIITFFFSCWLACQTWQPCPVLEYKRQHWKTAITRGLGGNCFASSSLLCSHSRHTQWLSLQVYLLQRIPVSMKILGWNSNLLNGKLGNIMKLLSSQCFGQETKTWGGINSAPPLYILGSYRCIKLVQYL